MLKYEERLNRIKKMQDIYKKKLGLKNIIDIDYIIQALAGTFLPAIIGLTILLLLDIIRF